MDGLVLVGAIVLVLVGMVGVLVPVLPGLLLVFVGTAGSLLWQDADTTAWVLTAVLGVLFLAGSAATIVLPARTGLQGGAARSSFLLAGLGAVVGIFVIPILGFLLGGAAGLLVGEYRRLGDWEPAWATTKQSIRAYGVGVLVEFVLGMTMITIWLLALLFR